jgi:hypothetical protein
VVFCDWPFPQHNVVKVRSRCSMYQHFIPLYGQIIFHCMDIPQFMHSSFDRWAFELLPLGAVTNNTAVSAHI